MMRTVLAPAILTCVALLLLACDRRSGTRSPSAMVQMHDTEAVRQFLADDPKNIKWTNSAKETLLHLAVIHNTEAIVDLLLSKGADPNAAADNKWTPLHIAASSGRRGLIPKLIAAKADIEARNEAGSTPLKLACIHQPEAVKLLLSHGANVNAVDDFGCNALRICAINRNAAAARYLIDAGIDVSNVDKRGKTALDDAREAGATEVEALIVAALNARSRSPQK